MRRYEACLVLYTTLWSASVEQKLLLVRRDVGRPRPAPHAGIPAPEIASGWLEHTQQSVRTPSIAPATHRRTHTT